MIQVLEDRRVYLDYGPIQMVIDVYVKDLRSYKIGQEVAVQVIEQINLMKPWIHVAKSVQPSLEKWLSYPLVLQKMILALQQVSDGSYTPLVAVAGSFSEFAMEKAMELGGTRVIVNNGGDIAFRDIEDKPFVVAIPLTGHLSGSHLSVTMNKEMGIEGICTSGLGGRSFTKGIADQGVAMSGKASIADICATMIANETIVEDDHILRGLSEEIDSETDIPGARVTIKCGPLEKKQIWKALLRGYTTAEKLYEKRIIKGGIMVVQGEIMMIPENIAKMNVNGG